MTPEGKVKRIIKQILDKYKPTVYYYMPVPGGYGMPSLDYIGCVGGQSFAIEAKRPGAKATSRQRATIDAMVLAGAQVFEIDGAPEGLAALDAYLGDNGRRQRDTEIA